MQGMSAHSGEALTGIDHLRQSIGDILTTPIGSRVMRRDYGSRVPELVDAPLNRGTLVQIYAAAADALGQWEPRFRLERIRATEIEEGAVSIDVEGEYLPDGHPLRLEVTV